MNTNKDLTSEESLKIITDMIRTAKGNVKNNSFYFLLWGWVVAVANVGHFALIEFSNYEYPYLVWLITIPAWIISMVHGYRNAKKEKVKTYGDKLIMWTWIAFSICIIIVIFSGKFYAVITPTILLFIALATFTTGLIIRYKPLIYGGSSIWIFAVIAFLVSPAYSLLVAAIAIIVGYLIPGYKLKSA